MSSDISLNMVAEGSSDLSDSFMGLVWVFSFAVFFRRRAGCVIWRVIAGKINPMDL